VLGGGIDTARLMVRLDDLGSLLQPKRFHDSMITPKINTEYATSKILDFKYFTLLFQKNSYFNYLKTYFFLNSR